MLSIACFFGGVQTKMSWHSLLTAQYSESRVRAVQCYDDPTMAW